MRPAKQPEGGSSIGVAIVKTREELERALGELGHDSEILLAEAFIRGRECSCGVLEGFDPVLPPTEIRPKEDGFFSFEAKYQAGRTDEITPAEFPPDVVAEVQRYAAAAHAALGLSVYSRTDFIRDGAGVWALETNNLPGFTPTSLLPQQVAHCGMSYRDLVSHVIDESLRQWGLA
jgi:D-alanine-D-alanine ligase